MTAQAKAESRARPSSEEDIRKELKKLAQRGGEILYERVGLLSTLLATDSYKARFHGDRDAMLAHAQGEFFDDLAGLATTSELMAAYETLDRSAWERHRWNLARILSDLQDRLAARRRAESERRGDSSAPRRATLKELEAERGKKKEVEEQLAQERSKREMLEEACSRFQRDIDLLRAENERLKGRVQALEQVLKTHAAA